MGGDWGARGHLIFVKQRLRFLPGVLIGILQIHAAGRERGRGSERREKDSR